MNPGPELDALVAEKVMGWKVVRGGWKGRIDIARTLNKKGTAAGMPTEPCPPFSTSIADAWTVLEQVRMKVHSVSIRSDDDLDGMGYTVSVCWENGEAIVQNGSECPYAICAAALESVGVTVPG